MFYLPVFHACCYLMICCILIFGVSYNVKTDISSQSSPIVVGSNAENDACAVEKLLAMSNEDVNILNFAPSKSHSYPNTANFPRPDNYHDQFNSSTYSDKAFSYSNQNVNSNTCPIPTTPKSNNKNTSDGASLENALSNSQTFPKTEQTGQHSETLKFSNALQSFHPKPINLLPLNSSKDFIFVYPQSTVDNLPKDAILLMQDNDCYNTLTINFEKLFDSDTVGIGNLQEKIIKFLQTHSVKETGIQKLSLFNVPPPIDTLVLNIVDIVVDHNKNIPTVTDKTLASIQQSLYQIFIETITCTKKIWTEILYLLFDSDNFNKFEAKGTLNASSLIEYVTSTLNNHSHGYLFSAESPILLLLQKEAIHLFTTTSTYTVDELSAALRLLFNETIVNQISTNNQNILTWLHKNTTARSLFNQSLYSRLITSSFLKNYHPSCKYYIFTKFDADTSSLLDQLKDTSQESFAKLPYFLLRIKEWSLFNGKQTAVSVNLSKISIDNEEVTD